MFQTFSQVPAEELSKYYDSSNYISYPIFVGATKMPSIKRAREDADANIVGGHETARSRLLEPLIYSGTLDRFKYEDLTPAIGREFEGLQVTDLLNGKM